MDVSTRVFIFVSSCAHACSGTRRGIQSFRERKYFLLLPTPDVFIKRSIYRLSLGSVVSEFLSFLEKIVWLQRMVGKDLQLLTEKFISSETMAETHNVRYERAFPLPSPVGKLELKIQQGGAGRFYIIATLPATPNSNEIVLSIPTELADSLTHAIGKAADYSGE